jgi:hypothetical protein
VSECLQTMPQKNRQELAKFLKASLGKKRAKAVPLSKFSPKTDTIWEAGDINRLVQEFEDFLNQVQQAVSDF